MKYINCKIVKIFFAVVLSIFADATEAAEVVWDKVSFSGSAIEWKTQDSSRYWLYVTLSYCTEGENWTISPNMSIPEFYGILYVAEKGATVTASSAATANPIFAEHRPWRSETSDWTSISGKGDAEVFLAIVLYDNSRLDDYEANPIYGWAKFDASDNLTLVTSAMSLDGSPLVIGAIPEPSAGMLLLIGFAGLALRRRRTRYPSVVTKISFLHLFTLDQPRQA